MNASLLRTGIMRYVCQHPKSRWLGYIFCHLSCTAPTELFFNGLKSVITLYYLVIDLKVSENCYGDINPITGGSSGARFLNYILLLQTGCSSGAYLSKKYVPTELRAEISEVGQWRKYGWLVYRQGCGH